MTNPITRQQMEAVFAKLAAWPYAPADVAQKLQASGAHDTAADVVRGQKIVDTAQAAGRAGARGAEIAGRGLSAALAPAHGAGTALAKELGEVGAGLMNRPGLMRAGAGALLLAPIMASSLHGTQQRREDELMNLQMNPARGFEKMSRLDLDAFLEKKAEVRERMLPAIRGQAFTSFTEGVGKGVGGGIAQAILGVLGGGIAKTWDSLIVDPKRKRLFESVVRSDQVVADALARNPHAAQTLTEAYQTMVRFAPSLSLDVNAVRSFLREAVVGGAAGVNYATIKSLIETEKANSSGHRSHP